MTEDEPGVAAVAMSFEILEAIDDRDGAGVSELARELDRSKSGVYKHVQTLTRGGYLVKDDGKYDVALPLWALGAGARDRFPVEAGRTAVDSLAASIDNVVSLVLYEGGTAVSAYQQRPPGTERSSLGVGDAYPLHATAAGKAILAYLPEEEREARLADPDSIAERLAEIREHRTAFERGEYEPSVRGVAAPILDGGDPVGAIAVAGTEDELPTARLENDLPGIVVSASRSVESAL